MKVENKSSLYFSAYRLKTLEAAIEESHNSSEQASPYLKSILDNKVKPMSRIRISTMVNPYTDTNLQKKNSSELQ